jgi:hypothetical protein
MIAVSNTTPLRYLIAIGQDDLLAKLFKKVFVPTGVHEELTDCPLRRASLLFYFRPSHGRRPFAVLSLTVVVSWIAARALHGSGWLPLWTHHFERHYS